MDKLSIYVNSKSTWVRRQAAIGEKRASKAFFIVTACRTDDDAVIRISIFEEKVMALGMVLDPTATRTDDIASPGPDAGMLIGKRVGFRLDRMWRAWDWISEIWAQRF